MREFTPWLGLCHIHAQANDSPNAQPTLAAVWADSIESFEREMHVYTNAHSQQMIWTEQVMPADEWLRDHPHRMDAQRLASKVNAKRPVALGWFGVRATGPGMGRTPDGDAEGYLHIEEIEGVKPLDMQFGVHPPKTVPNALYEPLFGQPDPTTAEMAQFGGADKVPPLKTYLVADVFHFSDWESEVDKFTHANKCLFGGKAQKQFSETAPYLIELQIENDFTRKLFTHLEGFHKDSMVHHWHRPYGIFVRSREPFEEVYNHLRRFTKLQNESGKWFFRRFWDARHSYAFIPLLQNNLEISARFFGHTIDRLAPRIQSYAVLMGKHGCLRIATWNEDEFFEQGANEKLPKSRTQCLNPAYLKLLNQASERVSAFKVVDYLLREFTGEQQIGDGSRLAVENFAVHIRSIALNLGVASELGWTRVASVAAHLGTGFLDDPRYAGRGLSCAKIGQDSQGEKVFFIGNECIKQIQSTQRKFNASAFIKVISSAERAIDRPTSGMVLNAVKAIDPNADWHWDHGAIRKWGELFISQMGRELQSERHVYEQIALAYIHGLEFRTDRRFMYHSILKNKSGVDYTDGIADIFNQEFGGGSDERNR